MQLGSHSVGWSWMPPHVPSSLALYLLHFIRLIISSTPLALGICHSSLVRNTVKGLFLQIGLSLRNRSETLESQQENVKSVRRYRRKGQMSCGA